MMIRRMNTLKRPLIGLHYSEFFCAYFFRDQFTTVSIRGLQLLLVFLMVQFLLHFVQSPLVHLNRMRQVNKSGFRMDQITIKTPNPKGKVVFSKKSTCKGIGRQVFICLGPLTSQVFVWGCKAILQVRNQLKYTVYKSSIHTSVLMHTGKGGGGQPVRRLEGRQFITGVENTNMTDCISSL